MHELGILFGRARGGHVEDDRLELDAAAADALGIPYAVIALDDVLSGFGERAVAHIPHGIAARWLYRGWILFEEEYEELYEAVEAHGELLVTQPHQYAEAAYLPNWAPLLEGDTPPSIWTEDTDARLAWEMAQDELGPPPWILKDHMKSAKEHWHEACFVPQGTSFERFCEICECFVDLQGDRFQRGLVVRRFVELKPTGYRSAERPMHDEHRLIFWQGELVASVPYHDVDFKALCADEFAWLGERIDSPFFTADVARLKAGGALVIELNDGGFSTLPELLDPRDLYATMLDS